MSIESYSVIRSTLRFSQGPNVIGQPGFDSRSDTERRDSVITADARHWGFHLAFLRRKPDNQILGSECGLRPRSGSAPLVVSRYQRGVQYVGRPRGLATPNLSLTVRVLFIELRSPKKRPVVPSDGPFLTTFSLSWLFLS